MSYNNIMFVKKENNNNKKWATGIKDELMQKIYIYIYCVDEQQSNKMKKKIKKTVTSL